MQSLYCFFGFHSPLKNHHYASQFSGPSTRKSESEGTAFSSVTPPRSCPDVKGTEYQGDLFYAANMKQYSL